MPIDKALLPTVTIPTEGMELLEGLRAELRPQFNGKTPPMTELLRLLISESPQLVDFARRTGQEINFTVGPHGGYKVRRSDKS